MASSPRPGARSRWSSRSWSRPSAWSWCECGAWLPNSTYRERHKKRAPRRAPFAKIEFRLGGADVIRPGTLLALLDVEAHSLATAQTVKVERGVDATLVEEVLLTIVGGDEPKSAVGNDFLYGAFWHCRSPPLEHRMERIGPVRERRMPAAREVARRPSNRAVLYHTGQLGCIGDLATQRRRGQRRSVASLSPRPTRARPVVASRPRRTRSRRRKSPTRATTTA